jgi:hypothetical protein
MATEDWERELRRVRRQRDNARAALQAVFDIGVLSRSTEARIRAIAKGAVHVEK